MPKRAWPSDRSPTRCAGFPWPARMYARCSSRSARRTCLGRDAVLAARPSDPGRRLRLLVIASSDPAGGEAVLYNGRAIAALNSAHMIPTQDPERFNRTVLHFFDKPFATAD